MLSSLKPRECVYFQTIHEGFAQDPNEWFLDLLNVMGGRKNVNLHYIQVASRRKYIYIYFHISKTIKLSSPIPQYCSNYKTSDQHVFVKLQWSAECVCLFDNLTLYMQLALTIFTEMCLITMYSPLVASVSWVIYLMFTIVVVGCEHNDIRAMWLLLEIYECNKNDF